MANVSTTAITAQLTQSQQSLRSRPTNQSKSTTHAAVKPTNNDTQQINSAPITVSRSQLLKGALLASPAFALIPTQPSLAAAETYITAVADAPAVTTVVDLDTVSKVVLKTLSDCDLNVGIYPKFSYNASGGGGTGKVTPRPDGKTLDVVWDAASLNIPPISYNSTRIVGIPLPPPLEIKIVPQQLAGTVDTSTGEANLVFDARFEFSAGSLYHAAPLIVQTTLTTESSTGALLSGSGKRLAADGTVRLAGVARVPKTGTDAFLDTFLMLPTDALAVLSAELKFS